MNSVAELDYGIVAAACTLSQIELGKLRVERDHPDWRPPRHWGWPVPPHGFFAVSELNYGSACGVGVGRDSDWRCALRTASARGRSGDGMCAMVFGLHAR